MRDAFQGTQKAQKSAPKTPPKYAIPSQYSSAEKTELRQKVPPSGEVRLELKSK